MTATTPESLSPSAAPAGSSPSAAPLLDIRDLSICFDTDDGVIHAVNQVSLQVYPGERVGLVGESGCGKSVTAMAIPRLVPSPPGRVVEGSIRFRGEEVLTMPITKVRQLRGEGVGVIFQEPMTALSPLHTIGKQLEESLIIHRREMPPAARKELALKWLRKVGIADPQRCYDAWPFQLSGGMRQRVMVAMAMLLEPSLVIADEPTTALDVTIQAQILDLLKNAVTGESPRALLLITHDLGVIWEMCHRVIVMYASRIMEEAPVEELFRNPCHPYTRALLAAVPALHNTPETLSSIPGQVPSLINPPAGCPFAQRCKEATQQCHTQVPPLVEVTPGHRCRCHLCNN